MAVTAHEPMAARPLRRDAEANRQQILEAAGRLMAERGLATPLGDIAAEAGVGIGTLYRRFPTRDDLIAALFEDRMAAYLSDLHEALCMPDGWDALVWFLKTASARQVSDRALSELLEHEPAQAAIRQLRDQIWPLAETLVRRAIDTGSLRPDFTVSDLGFVQQMLVMVGASTRSVNDTAWERYLTLVIDGLAASRPGYTPLPGPVLDKDQVLRLPRP